MLVIFLEYNCASYFCRKTIQGLEDALEPQNHDDVDILKVLQSFVWSNTFFKFTNKTPDR